MPKRQIMQLKYSSLTEVLLDAVKSNISEKVQNESLGSKEFDFWGRYAPNSD
jgi:hypothetical protein